jgi:hypothetical protein
MSSNSSPLNFSSVFLKATRYYELRGRELASQTRQSLVGSKFLSHSNSKLMSEFQTLSKEARNTTVLFQTYCYPPLGYQYPTFPYVHLAWHYGQPIWICKCALELAATAASKLQVQYSPKKPAFPITYRSYMHRNSEGQLLTSENFVSLIVCTNYRFLGEMSVGRWHCTKHTATFCQRIRPAHPCTWTGGSPCRRTKFGRDEEF